MKRLIIFGAGGHAREIHQLVEDINAAGPAWEMVGFVVDAAFRVDRSVHGLPVLCGTEAVTAEPRPYVSVGIGIPAARRQAVGRLQSYASPAYPCLVHPHAWVANRATIGEGTVVFAGSLINCGARVGCHVSVNLGVTISHDCVVEDFASLGPGVHLAGGVTIGACSDLGTGVSVRPGIRIGADCVVGAGAVVVADLPAGATAYGVPARPVRLRR